MSGRDTMMRSAYRRVIAARRRRQLSRIAEQNRGRPNADIFGSIYRDAAWGSTGDFDSGIGSHRVDLVQPYVDAVTTWLSGLPERPDVVDLGCGDFNVGRQIRPSCGRYVAVDVVPDLVERNRGLPGCDDVEFVVADLVADALPVGDVATLRQVLQHLSNDSVAAVVAKLQQYRYVIVTDHQPRGSFVANVDIPSGSEIREALGSGLDLTAPPFALQHEQAWDICVVPFDDSVVRTTVFRLA